MQTKAGHLTYCTNIHAGESWTVHFSEIRKYFPVIKNLISPGLPMGLGLRLSNMASLELAETTHLQDFKQWLQEHEAYVFTMNGFPYGGFHHTRVKDQVHAPDWTTKNRVEYTLRLFDILKALLPEGMDGGVSTSPLSYRHWFDSEQLTRAQQSATDNIITIAEHLIRIRKTSGQLLHLDIEPEPDGLMESGNEFIEWFNEFLLKMGIPRIASTFSVSEAEAEAYLKAHICLCYDVCHFAIGFEKHREMIQKLDKNGIRTGKIQISAALKARINKGNLISQNAFAAFDESTYLHQVVASTGDGSLLRYRDLPEAMEDADNPLVKEWRAHFHVPVFKEDFGVLQSTRSDILEVLQFQKNKPFTQHLEIETYTWEVLPKDLKLPLQESIIRELQWVKYQLS